MNYNSFEEIPVWIQARKFVALIYKVTSDSFGKDFSLIDQIRRASVSIMLNISEGFERKSNKEFAHFINMAKGSAGEVRSIIYIAKDNKYIPDDQFNILFEEVMSISRQLSKFRTYLINNNLQS